MKLRYPTDYVAITQYYKEGVHNAVDLGWNSMYGGKSVPVKASESGTVVGVVNNYNKTDTSGSNYGNYVKIKHDDEFSTLYAHLEYNSVKVKVGDKVNKGDIVGIMGNTGRSNGNHVHYEVFKNNIKVNPILYSYVFSDQVVSSNKDAIVGLMYDNSSSGVIDVSDREEELNRREEELNKREEELNKYKFMYKVDKTSNYKIKLYKDEILYIKGN